MKQNYLKYYLASLADTNYYNETHKIIRINWHGKFFDFKFLGGQEVPNPSYHLVVVVTTEEVLDDIGYLSDLTQFLPGIADKQGTLRELPIGYAYLVPKNQSVSSSNPNSGGAGFSVNNTNMYDIENMALALAPPSNIDYTNSVDSDGNKNDSVGLFINKNGTILIKSKGSSITMGKEGTYLSGPISWESSEHKREILMDNSLHRFIPSALPTAAVAIPEIPNVAQFLQIASGAKKVRDIIDKVSAVTKLVGA